MYSSPSKFHYQRLQIIGCGSDPDEVAYPNPRLATRRRNYAYLLEQAGRGRLPLGKLITHTLPPQEIGNALSTLADGNKQMIGVVFDWNSIS